MKKYEITTYNSNGTFGYTFRDVETDKYIYTNEIFSNVLLFVEGFAAGKGEELDNICTIR